MARRMPISRERAADRAISRFATFTHEISSTSPVIPMRIFRVLEYSQYSQRMPEVPVVALCTTSFSPRNLSRSPAGHLFVLSLNDPSAWWNCGSSCARACGMETPGLRRPSTQTSSGLGSEASGAHIPGVRLRSTPKKSGGITPITVLGAPFSRTVAPTTEGSRPKWLLQKEYVSTTTWCSASGRSSVESMARPSKGLTPSVGKNDPDTS